MTTKRIVVTGASGFVGSHLVDRLLEQGRRVTAVDQTMTRNLEHASLQPDFSFVALDVRDRDGVIGIVDDDVAAIFHLAAVVGVDRYISNPIMVLDVNINGTRNVMEAAQRVDALVVFTSTSEIYGKNPKVPWSEDDDRVLGSTSTDRWSYSTSKAVGEHLLLGAHRRTGFRCTVARLFNVYGPRQTPTFAISRSIQRCLRGDPPFLYDEGRQTRCFTYVDDAVTGLLKAAEVPQAVGEIFNIGSDRETTILEAISLVIEAARPGLAPVRFDTAERFGGTYEDIPRRVPDVAKARRLLGWSAATSLQSGVAKTVQWAKVHPWWIDMDHNS